ncbi:MAG: AAA family ATPase [Mycoplasma sp.]
MVKKNEIIDEFLKNAWDKLADVFDENNESHIYSLVIILRNIIEQKIYEDDDDFKSFKKNSLTWSCLHNFIHYESIECDLNSVYMAIINLLTRVNSDKYKAIDIIKKISSKVSYESILQDVDWSNIWQPARKQHYKLKIISSQIVSFDPVVWIFYSKQDPNENKNKNIIFFSREMLTTGNIYNVKFNKFKIKHKDFFILESYNCLTTKTREAILLKNKISNIEELFPLLSGVYPQPYKYFDSHARKIMLDIINYYVNDFKNIEDTKKILPFLNNPFFNETKNGLNKKICHHMIRNYDETADALLQYNLKINLDNENAYSCHIEDQDTLKRLVSKRPDGQPNFKEIQLNKWNHNIEYIEYKKIIDLFNEINKKMIEDDLIELKIVNFTENDNNNLWKEINNYLIKHKICTLSSPAGTGKTTQIKQLMQHYLNYGRKICLICPTHKAINLYSDIEDKINTFTSEKVKKEEAENNIILNIDEGYDLVVIDEMTMISDWNFLAQLKGNKSRIIICGDKNQLQPIKTIVKQYLWLLGENSNVKIKKFGDKLSENHRSKGNKALIEIQRKILKLKDNKDSNDFYTHFCKKYPKNIMLESNENKLLSFLSDKVENNYKIITKYNSGILGVEFLNRYFSNSNSEDEFHINDSIIFVETDVDVSGRKYYNGLEGKIVEIIQKNTFIPGQPIVEHYKIEIKKGGPINICIDESKLPFTHSKAITAHKAQGSTYEKVIVLAGQAPQSAEDLDINWLYTAFSRASKDAIIIFTNKINLT